MATKIKKLEFSPVIEIPMTLAAVFNSSSSSSSSVTKTATGSMPTNLSPDKYADDPHTRQLKAKTTAEVDTIYMREHEMLIAVRHLALDLAQIPRYEKLATVSEIKSIIKGHLEGWIGDKITIPLDTLEHIQAFSAAIEKSRHEITSHNFDARQLPNAVLFRYEDEAQRRNNEIAALDERIEEAIAILATTAGEQEKRVLVDQQIGEMLVMKKFLSQYIQVHEHSAPQEGMDLSVVGKVYGCSIKPLEFLRVTSSERYPRTVTIEHLAYEPAIARIFKDYLVGQAKVDLAKMRDDLSKIITNEYLLPKMIQGEEHLIGLLEHYKNLAVELLTTPEAKRNPLVGRSFQAHAMSIIHNPHLAELKSEIEDWRASGFDRNEKGSQDQPYKEFYHFASKRIVMAHNNLTRFESGACPEKISTKYRNALIDTFTDLADLQNKAIESREKLHKFDLHIATRKATHAIKLVRMINNGEFFAF